MTLLNISLDGFILGESNENKSFKRLLLDCLNEGELIIVENIIQVVVESKLSSYC